MGEKSIRALMMMYFTIGIRLINSDVCFFLYSRV